MSNEKRQHGPKIDTMGLHIQEEAYKSDTGYIGRSSIRHLNASTTRRDGTIDMCMKEYRQYESGAFKTEHQFHSYDRGDIEALRDFLTAQLDDRKYW
ncbi:MAG: hypothetical protein K0U20_08600 [Proteobacteria bacterium]|nr:hypothetical protein [Pseudomonadota bacterium]